MMNRRRFFGTLIAAVASRWMPKPPESHTIYPINADASIRIAPLLTTEDAKALNEYIQLVAAEHYRDAHKFTGETWNA